MWSTRLNRSLYKLERLRGHLQQTSPELSQFKLGLGLGQDMAPMPTGEGKGRSLMEIETMSSHDLV